MLVRLKVKNFRNFEDWFDVDLRTHKNYEFNGNAVNNGLVRHGIIYGKNGSGKSNLGLALLDITSHLNDMGGSSTISGLNSNYINANSGLDLAEFEYQFKFGEAEVVYRYGKTGLTSLNYEKLTINGKSVIELDRTRSSKAHFNIQGAENLKNDFSNTKISALKYLSANAILDDSDNAKAFEQLITFVQGMVFFRTLSKRSEHHGIEVEIQRISKEIIDSGYLSDFEQFLNDAGVECQLKASGTQGDERIDFVFNGRNIEFSLVASSGTQSLGVFYFWWLKLNKGELTFAYIDEFDAFYHFELSKQIVKKLTQLSCQTLLTTHNTSIMNNDLLRPDCYFEVQSNTMRQSSDLTHKTIQYKPALKPFFSLVHKELRKAHNLEKIYKALERNTDNG